MKSVEAADQRRPGGDFLKRALADMAALLTGNAQGAAAHRAGRSPRAEKWSALEHEAATDAGSNRDIKERAELVRRAKQCFSEGGGAHVCFDDSGCNRA